MSASMAPFAWFKTVQDMVDAYNALWKNCKKRLTSTTVLPVGPKSWKQLLASGAPPPPGRASGRHRSLAGPKEKVRPTMWRMGEGYERGRMATPPP